MDYYTQHLERLLWSMWIAKTPRNCGKGHDLREGVSLRHDRISMYLSRLICAFKRHGDGESLRSILVI